MAKINGKLHMVSFLIEPSLLAEVDERAQRESRSRSWMLRKAVRAWIGQPAAELTAEPAEESA